ncbi:MAG: F0F1 ATP synthase subunit B [Bauldia sp.]|nr:F0F1 ATP synthase subunit B [Bauldia sp.]
MEGTATAGFIVAQLEATPAAPAEAAPAAEPGAPLTDAAHGELAGVVIEEHATEEHGGTFPPFDSTYFASQLLWLAISFVVLYLLMSRVIIPRIGGILEDRRDRIARDLDQAGRLKQQSDEANAAYVKALSDARANAFRIAAEARDKAKGEAAARQAEIEKSLDGKLAAAETRIGEIKAKALADVGAIAAEAAEAVVDRLVGLKASATELKDAVGAARSGGTGNA